METNTPPAVLTVARMARRIGVTQAWLKAEAAAGKLPCVRAGKRFLFAADAVEAALAERAAAKRGGQ